MFHPQDCCPRQYIVKVAHAKDKKVRVLIFAFLVGFVQVNVAKDQLFYKIRHGFILTSFHNFFLSGKVRR